ncbi:MAG TPA: Asp23/Gls24 family envelope stress response protein [Planctomycetota bacterium]|nr:Asp23/Gls24 family envelope stress response protein [Planctomycetota bacterium]
MTEEKIENKQQDRDEPTEFAENEQLAELERFAQAVRPPPLPSAPITSRTIPQPHKESRKERKVLHIDQEMGTLDITATVIASIVREEGRRIDGVVEIRGRGLGNKLRKLFHSGHIADGVYVEKNDGVLFMEVTLAARYGVNIPAIAETVRRRLAEKIEFITGYRVAAINIVVDRIIVADQTPKAGQQKEGQVKHGAGSV